MNSPMLAHIRNTTIPTVTEKKNDKWLLVVGSVSWVLLWIYAFDILALAQ